MPPYQVRGSLIKSDMTVYIVIPAEAGIQRNSGCTLLITRYRLLSFDLGRWTLDFGLLLSYSSRFRGMHSRIYPKHVHEMMKSKE